jgi:hypothetical protein
VFESGIVCPLNTVYRTGVDRFLDGIEVVSILAKYSGSTMLWFDEECIVSDMGTISTADASQFIYVYALLSPYSSQLWL